VLGVLQSEVSGPGTPGLRLWEEGAVSRLMAVIETPEAMDAGYWSEDNVKLCADQGLDAYIATGRLPHGQPPAPKRGPLPRDADARTRMVRKLRSKKESAIYAQCKAIVEPVNGQIKEGRGLRRFLLRGLEKVDGEWHLIAGRLLYGRQTPSGVQSAGLLCLEPDGLRALPIETWAGSRVDSGGNHRFGEHEQRSDQTPSPRDPLLLFSVYDAVFTKVPG
jgi:hypothetical protein